MVDANKGGAKPEDWIKTAAIAREKVVIGRYEEAMNHYMMLAGQIQTFVTVNKAS